MYIDLGEFELKTDGIFRLKTDCVRSSLCALLKQFIYLLKYIRITIKNKTMKKRMANYDEANVAIQKLYVPNADTD